MSEVQDFSMPSKTKHISSNKGKLDSMLDKVAKRKNIVSLTIFNLIIIIIKAFISNHLKFY